MAEALAHRGPDDDGVWIDEAAGVGLGHRRLAVIELSPAGHQPMHSACGRYVTAFNGEIYNHRELRTELERSGMRAAWRGQSDTETLLACFARWGIVETLRRVVGMFAIALWDRSERRLYLARDRMGEKPLYYGWTQGAFVFGSELKALRRYPGFDNLVDRDVLALYARFQYVPAPYAIYRSIYKLEPGCVLSLCASDASSRPCEAPRAPARLGSLTVERYWSLAEVARRGLDDPIGDERTAVDELEETLSTAVRLQALADVPLGAFLSGGVDSSTIVALMQRQTTARMRTFTIGFEESGYDEAENARAVARHLGTDHTELYVSPKQALAVIPDLPRLYCEPFADSSQIPTHLVSQMASRHVTVALSGDGGDELFGGYNRYVHGQRIWNAVGRLPRPLRRVAGAGLEAVAPSTWNAFGKCLPIASQAGSVGDKIHKVARAMARSDSPDDLYLSLVTQWEDSVTVWGARSLPTRLDDRAALRNVHEPEHRMMLLDGLTYLPDDILHKVDRAAMGASLETRVPLLDHRVAELAWRLPLDMKIRNGQGKWALRQVLYRHVPRELIERPKAGFAVPVGQWLRGPLRDWAEDLLSPLRLADEGHFSCEPVRRKWNQHLAGSHDWTPALWAVLMFQAWSREQRQDPC